MKKYKIEILCDEFYVADSLHELATNIECGDVLDGEYADENGVTAVTGDHYTAEVKEVKVPWDEKLEAIVVAAKQQNFSDETDDIETLTYTDGKGNVYEDRFDCIDTTTIPYSVRFIAGTGHKNYSVPIGWLTGESIDKLYECVESK